MLVFPIASVSASTTSTGAIPIKHVFIIVQENHTFDNYFGYYPGANGLAGAKPQALPNGTLVAPFEIDTTTVPNAPNLLCHAASCARADFNDGKMDGFLTETGENSTLPMGYFNPDLIPYYWDYASENVLMDNLFSPFMGPSLPNHIYLLAGQSGGVTSDNDSAVLEIPTIVQELDAANVSWVYYAGDHAGTNGWNPLPADIPYLETHPSDQGLKESTSFPADVAKPNFPSVAWIMPESDQLSEHPPYNVTAGELSVVAEINDIMESQYWNSSMIFLTWDDYGGWYDHVSPPQVDSSGFGFRVPGLIISPYAKQGYIDSTAAEFASTLKLIETIFHVPSLTSRDAKADNLLEAFNFNQAPRAPLILPGPFIANHYPLTYKNGTVAGPLPPGQPGKASSSTSTTDIEYSAILISAVVVLIVVVSRFSPKSTLGDV